MSWITLVFIAGLMGLVLAMIIAYLHYRRYRIKYLFACMLTFLSVLFISFVAGLVRELKVVEEGTAIYDMLLYIQAILLIVGSILGIITIAIMINLELKQKMPQESERTSVR